MTCAWRPFYCMRRERDKTSEDRRKREKEREQGSRQVGSRAALILLPAFFQLPSSWHYLSTQLVGCILRLRLIWSWLLGKFSKCSSSVDLHCLNTACAHRLREMSTGFSVFVRCFSSFQFSAIVLLCYASRSLHPHCIHVPCYLSRTGVIATLYVNLVACAWHVFKINILLHPFSLVLVFESWLRLDNLHSQWAVISTIHTQRSLFTMYEAIGLNVEKLGNHWLCAVHWLEEISRASQNWRFPVFGFCVCDDSFTFSLPEKEQ